MSEQNENFNKDDIAVALSYDDKQNKAPIVVATGKGSVAEQIIEVAKKHNIKIHKDEELAKILSVLDVDSIIPIEAYAAVAEILSYIYKTNAKYRDKKEK